MEYRNASNDAKRIVVNPLVRIKTIYNTDISTELGYYILIVRLGISCENSKEIFYTDEIEGLILDIINNNPINMYTLLILRFIEKNILKLYIRDVLK